MSVCPSFLKTFWTRKCDECNHFFVKYLLLNRKLLVKMVVIWRTTQRIIWSVREEPDGIYHRIVLNFSCWKQWQRCVSDLKFLWFSWPVIYSCHCSCYALNVVNWWCNSATRSRVGLMEFISIFTKHWSWVLIKSYWENSYIICVCLYKEWFSPYICVWEPKWLMEQSSHFIRKRQGWKNRR